MGVIYQNGDDVGELLIPFIHNNGSSVSIQKIEYEYRQASLGQISAIQFWNNVGLNSSFEDEYLSLHQLKEGLLKFIKFLKENGFHIACLSNDVGEWSKKLREKFNLDDVIQEWMISGDLGLRKPDPNIYLTTLDLLQVLPQQIIFIDDRVTNVLVAKGLGINSIFFRKSKILKG